MKRGEIPFLPQEIITNILIRLPIKSLIRFQCVCKGWNDILRSSSFTVEHLSHSRKNPCLLSELWSRPYSLRSSFLDHRMNFVGVQSIPMIGSPRHAHTVGSCNGLICVLNHSRRRMIIWNPYIGESIQVPGVIDSYKCLISFGFDSTINDYKIVIISNCSIENMRIYSLRTRAWKDVEFEKLDDVILTCNNGADLEECESDGVALCSEFYSITSNGAIFWRGIDKSMSDCVVSFDLALEVFTLIPLPLIRSNRRNYKLVVFQNNELAMLYVRTTKRKRNFFVDMWVLQESAGASGSRWSWIKKYSSSPFPYPLAPRIIWKNIIVCDIDLYCTYVRGEMKIVQRKKSILFNLATQEYKIVKMNDRIDNVYDPVFIHVESLISIHNNHLQER